VTKKIIIIQPSRGRDGQAKEEMGKIIEKLLKTYQEGGTTVSFEFFPAKTDEGLQSHAAAFHFLLWFVAQRTKTMTPCLVVCLYYV
jgi:hypothetical protein